LIALAGATGVQVLAVATLPCTQSCYDRNKQHPLLSLDDPMRHLSPLLSSNVT